MLKSIELDLQSFCQTKPIHLQGAFYVHKYKKE